ncbi:hypothetical protein KAT63_04880 [Candidatus Parcubacteria bacterium]|nr:hypothetical protein [Candidatus Parcubacteria bacterium]
MLFKELIMSSDNIKKEVKKASEISEQTYENVKESHDKLEQTHKNIEKSHNEEEKALERFEAIEAELLEKLGDDFEGLSHEDAVRVFKISERCPRHIILSDPLYLKIYKVLEEVTESE